MNTPTFIPTFDEAYNYFLLQQEDEAYTARIRFEEAILASTYAEEEAAHEAEEEASCAPLYMAEEQAMAQDGAKKAKHRKSRRAERDEYHHHRKPLHKWNRDWNDEFALDRKREKHRLNVHNLLSQYEAEAETEEVWENRRWDEEELYLYGDRYNCGLESLWEDVSENGMFSYSSSEDFDNKFKVEVEENEEEDYDEEYDEEYTEEDRYEIARKCGYTQGHNVGYHEGLEAGKRYILDLLKEVGISVNLDALIEQSLK